MVFDLQNYFADMALVYLVPQRWFCIHMTVTKIKVKNTSLAIIQPENMKWFILESIIHPKKIREL